MINDWINDGIHPITGLKEYFRAYNPKVGAKHDYKYEFENKHLANMSIKEQKYA